MPPGLGTILADNLCVRVRMESRFTLDTEADEPLVEFMELAGMPGMPSSSALPPTRQMRFGALTKADNEAYSIVGRLNRILREGAVSVGLSLTIAKVQGPPRQPPQSYYPAFRVLSASKRLFGPQEFNCTVEFEYTSEQGIASIVPLPLMIVLTPDAGVTHIESAIFGRRTHKGKEYSVLVIPESEYQSLHHGVIFSQVCLMTSAAIGRVVRKARSLSAKLLEEGAGG